MAHAGVAKSSDTGLGKDVFLNENQRFKSRYGLYVRRSTYASLLIWLLIFLFSPVYKPTPYTLREQKIEILDIPDAMDIPPPPKEIPRPQVPIEAAPDAEVDEDVELAETLPDNWDAAPLPSGGGSVGAGGNTFVAFDTKPEILIRKALFASGLRYRLHARGLPGRPNTVERSCCELVQSNSRIYHTLLGQLSFVDRVPARLPHRCSARSMR